MQGKCGKSYGRKKVEKNLELSKIVRTFVAEIKG